MAEQCFEDELSEPDGDQLRGCRGILNGLAFVLGAAVGAGVTWLATRDWSFDGLRMIGIQL